MLGRLVFTTVRKFWHSLFLVVLEMSYYFGKGTRTEPWAELWPEQESLRAHLKFPFPRGSGCTEPRVEKAPLSSEVLELRKIWWTGLVLPCPIWVASCWESQHHGLWDPCWIFCSCFFILFVCLLFLVVFVVVVFLDRVALYNSPGYSETHCRQGWPWTHWDPHSSASQMLGLKTCATTACLVMGFLIHI